MAWNSQDMYTDNFAGSIDAWEKMKTDFPNIEVKTFPKEVLTAMKKAADELYANYAAKDTSFKEVYNSQQAYLKKARTWTSISEYKYINTSQELSE